MVRKTDPNIKTSLKQTHCSLEPVNTNDHSQHKLETFLFLRVNVLGLSNILIVRRNVISWVTGVLHCVVRRSITLLLVRGDANL